MKYMPVEALSFFNIRISNPWDYKKVDLSISLIRSWCQLKDKCGFFNI